MQECVNLVKSPEKGNMMTVLSPLTTQKIFLKREVTKIYLLMHSGGWTGVNMTAARLTKQERV